MRELVKSTERAVVPGRTDQIDLEDVPPALRKQDAGRKRITFEVGTQIRVAERRMIEETLRYCNGDKSLAASLLGITARTIYRREAEWAEEG